MRAEDARSNAEALKVTAKGLYQNTAFKTAAFKKKATRTAATKIARPKPLRGVRPAAGRAELRRALSRQRGLFLAVGLFSAFANLLMLTGPLYMLQVYDRVLNSQSVETLVALTGLVAFLYINLAILDVARGRLLARAGARFQKALDKRVFEAAMSRSEKGCHPQVQTAEADLEAIQRFVASPAPIAVFDMVWTPVFLVGIAIFHPWLGGLALLGGVLLVFLAGLNQIASARPVTRVRRSGRLAAQLAEHMRTEGEVVRGLGIWQNAFGSWQSLRIRSLMDQLSATDVAGLFSSTTKAFRLFLQSAMLGLGAYIVLRGELSAGAMIAASVLLGRALAPIELAIAHWPGFQRARHGWHTLSRLLEIYPERVPQLALPAPQARLDVQSLTVVPPGRAQAALRLVSFELGPGQVLAVTGASGSGKSTLARAVVGTWPTAGGKIRLGGAALDQYRPQALAEAIGYLPQHVPLFEGTIAENIARLDRDFDDAQVVRAAQQAGAHEMILTLPEGYNTSVPAAGGGLSGGQIQRIGLARALYSDPVLLVLDEPDAHLDAAGRAALYKAVAHQRAQRKTVIIMAHHPLANLQCDKVLELKNGQMERYSSPDGVYSACEIARPNVSLPLTAVSGG